MTRERPRHHTRTVQLACRLLAWQPAPTGSALPALPQAAQPSPERPRASLRKPAWVRPGLPLRPPRGLESP